MFLNGMKKNLVDHACDPEKVVRNLEGSITMVKKHGFFHEGIWHGRSTRSFDGIFYAKNYRNGLKG